MTNTMLMSLQKLMLCLEGDIVLFLKIQIRWQQVPGSCEISVNILIPKPCPLNWVQKLKIPSRLTFRVAMGQRLCWSPS